MLFLVDLIFYYHETPNISKHAFRVFFPNTWHILMTLPNYLLYCLTIDFLLATHDSYPTLSLRWFSASTFQPSGWLQSLHCLVCSSIFSFKDSLIERTHEKWDLRCSMFSLPSVNITPSVSNTDLTLIFWAFEMHRVSFSPLHPLWICCQKLPPASLSPFLLPSFSFSLPLSILEWLILLNNSLVSKTKWPYISFIGNVWEIYLKSRIPDIPCSMFMS